MRGGKIIETELFVSEILAFGCAARSPKSHVTGVGTRDFGTKARAPRRMWRITNPANDLWRRVLVRVQPSPNSYFPCSTPTPQVGRFKHAHVNTRNIIIKLMDRTSDKDSHRSSEGTRGCSIKILLTIVVIITTRARAGSAEHNCALTDVWRRVFSPVKTVYQTPEFITKHLGQRRSRLYRTLYGYGTLGNIAVTELMTRAVAARVYLYCVRRQRIYLITDKITSTEKPTNTIRIICVTLTRLRAEFTRS